MTELIVNCSDQRQRDNLIATVDALRGNQRVTIVQYRPRRTDAQNRYLWGVVYPMIAQHLCRENGEALVSEDVHAMLKEKFLRADVRLQSEDASVGQVIGWRVKSTTELSTTEMWDYIERIRMWAADMLDLGIPEPGQYEPAPAAA